jgi:hypothetical protein
MTRLNFDWHTFTWTVIALASLAVGAWMALVEVV